MKYCLNCHEELGKRHSKYCSNRCQIDYQQKIWEQKWKAGLVSGRRGAYDISGHLRTYLLKKYNYQCSVCGWHEINQFTGNVPLEVDHIDGDYTNNAEENLTVLCHNCHSLTQTYKGANYGHGRSSRRKYYAIN